MGKYTYNEKYDKGIEKQLEVVKDILRKETKPISIVLFGGFGKGEGVVDNGKPMNDFDIYLITKNKLDDEYVEELGVKCAKALGYEGLEFAKHPDESYDNKKFFHVDIRNIKYSRLPKLMHSQRNFELKYGSQILYGENIFKKIPDFKVPVSDAIRLLFNKMHHLLLSKDNSKQIKLIHINKAFLDCCTALLIFENNFKPRYNERNEAFQSMNFPKELKEKVKYASEFRMKPDFESAKDIDKLWGEAKYWVGYSFLYIITRHLKINSEDWQGVVKIIDKKLPYIYFEPYLPNKYLFFLQYYLNLKFVVSCWKEKKFIIKPIFYWKDAGIRLALPLILYLYGNERDSEKYLRRITNNSQPLKMKILEYYGLYYSQKLI